MEKKPFSELGISPEVLKAVTKMGFEEATPIQSAAIPVMMSGRDIVGQSQTGSGKTAAFAIPLIERVKGDQRRVQALVLCPTRELAAQVAEEVAKLAVFKKGVRELPIYGGGSYDRQLRGLREGVQIVIGTPGRIMDHLERGTLSLDDVQAVVLDEADRMLDMGFRDDIEHILSKAPAERQTVLFSATLPPGLRSIIQRFTRDPADVRIENTALTVPDIDQVYYEIPPRAKTETLCRLIDLSDYKLGIVFCQTRVGTDDLCEHLVARGYRADKLHGDMTQAMRERVLARFKRRQVEFLVATDVAARGLDVDDVEVVFNYDLPHDGEDYVHRIGRTGRAGRAGKAITFVTGRDVYKLQHIQRFTKSRIRRERVPTLDEVEERRAEALFERLRETLERADYRRHDEALDRLLENGHAPTDIASALIHLLGSADTSKPQAPNPKGDRPDGGDASRSPNPRPQSIAEPVPMPARPEREKDFADRPSAPEGFREQRPQRPEPAPFRRESPPPFRERERERDRGGSNNNRDEGGGLPPARSHEAGMVRLVFNVGEQHEIRPGDIVGVIAGVTRRPKEIIGAIHILPRQSLVDVARDEHQEVLEKLNGIRFKGRKLAVDVARERA